MCFIWTLMLYTWLQAKQPAMRLFLRVASKAFPNPTSTNALTHHVATKPKYRPETSSNTLRSTNFEAARADAEENCLRMFERFITTSAAHPQTTHN